MQNPKVGSRRRFMKRPLEVNDQRQPGEGNVHFRVFRLAPFWFAHFQSGTVEHAFYDWNATPGKRGGLKVGEYNARDCLASHSAKSPSTLILRTLRAAGGMIGGPRGAAARLGLKRTTLLSKMKRLGIYRPRHQQLIDEVNE